MPTNARQPLDLLTQRDSTDSMPTFIDVFAGAGGLSLGFLDAGFRPVAAIESDPDASSTYSKNFDTRIIDRDITRVDVQTLPHADVVIGGPPCQGFSPLGRMNGSGHKANNRLWREFIKVVEAVRPSAIVLENVPAFMKSREFAGLSVRLRRRGLRYEFSAGVLNAQDFGVAQSRKRAFLIGIKDGGPPGLPEAAESGLTTLKDKIAGLPAPGVPAKDFGSGVIKSGLDLHFKRNPTKLSLKRYGLIPPGGSRFDLMRAAPEITPRCWMDKPTGSTDVFGRLEWDAPCVTIRTEFFKPEKGRYLHPEEDRAITHLEGALIQGFPFDFKWVGTKTSIARQIGNAVPPPLAKAIAAHLLTRLPDGVDDSPDMVTTSLDRL